MMRRNKLTLEHIMHERGKNVAEDQLLAKLHVELRNLESKEKGPTEVITVSRAISKQSNYGSSFPNHQYFS
jgi:hypothetical protein